VDYALAVARSFTDEVDELIRGLVAERDALRAAVAKVQALHRDTRPANGPHACDVCGEFEWPCETLAVLAAVPTEPTGETE